MNKIDLTKKIKDVSCDAFVRAVAHHAEVEKSEAKKLVRMYTQFRTENKEETLKDVLANLDLNEEISVRAGDPKS